MESRDAAQHATVHRMPHYTVLHDPAPCVSTAEAEKLSFSMRPLSICNQSLIYQSPTHLSIYHLSSITVSINIYYLSPILISSISSPSSICSPINHPSLTPILISITYHLSISTYAYLSYLSSLCRWSAYHSGSLVEKTLPSLPEGTLGYVWRHFCFS